MVVYKISMFHFHQIMLPISEGKQEESVNLEPMIESSFHRFIWVQIAFSHIYSINKKKLTQLSKMSDWNPTRG